VRSHGRVGIDRVGESRITRAGIGQDAIARVTDHTRGNRSDWLGGVVVVLDDAREKRVVIDEETCEDIIRHVVVLRIGDDVSNVVLVVYVGNDRHVECGKIIGFIVREFDTHEFTDAIDDDLHGIVVHDCVSFRCL
jgi:hypothetical protein